jgi:hypothetical protein
VEHDLAEGQSHEGGWLVGAVLEGVALPWPPLLRRLARPVLAVSRWRHRHHVPHDVDGIERHVRAR